jgi:hypothetical protein
VPLGAHALTHSMIVKLALQPPVLRMLAVSVATFPRKKLATTRTCVPLGKHVNSQAAIARHAQKPPIECDECLVQATCDNVNCAYGSTCKVTPHSCNGCSSAICVVDGCYSPIQPYFEECTTSKTSPYQSTAPTAAYSPAPTDYSTEAEDTESGGGDAQSLKSSGHSVQMGKVLELVAILLVVIVVVV